MKIALTCTKFVARCSKITFYSSVEAIIIIYFSYFLTFLPQYLSFHFSVRFPLLVY